MIIQFFQLGSKTQTSLKPTNTQEHKPYRTIQPPDLILTYYINFSNKICQYLTLHLTIFDLNSPN